MTVSVCYFYMDRGSNWDKKLKMKSAVHDGEGDLHINPN
jgi:hypothetical protein